MPTQLLSRSTTRSLEERRKKDATNPMIDECNILENIRKRGGFRHRAKDDSAEIIKTEIYYQDFRPRPEIKRLAAEGFLADWHFVRSRQPRTFQPRPETLWPEQFKALYETDRKFLNLSSPEIRNSPQKDLKWIASRSKPICLKLTKVK